MIKTLGIIESCIIYFIVFACPCFVALTTNKHSTKLKSCLIIVSLIPIIFFSAFRYGVGTDFFTYNDIFSYLKKYTLFQLINLKYPKEFFFKFIINLLYNYSNQFIFGIFNLLTILPVVITLKKYYKQSNVSFFISLFFYMFFLFHISFNAIRQCLACSIIFLSINYIFKNKLILYFFLLIIANSFHSSSKIAILIPLFWNYKQNRTIKFNKTLVILLLLSIAILTWPYIFNFLNINEFSSYASRKASGNNYSFYIKLFFTIFCLFFRKKLIKYDYRNSLYINLQLLALIFTLGGFFYPYIVRCAWFFEYTNIYLISSIPYIISKNNYNRLMCVLTIILICIFWFYGVECGFFKTKINKYYLPVRFLINK